MVNTTVSIIIPMYNCAQTIEQCIRSIIKQSYEAVEIVLINDGSIDGTEDICNGYKAEDGRVRYFYQKNQGVSAARNKGLELATGDLIAWVDADDWIEPDMIERLVGAMDSFSADMAVCGLQKENGDAASVFTCFDVTVWDKKTAQKLILEDVKLQSYLCNKLFKRKLFDGIQFPIGRKYEDQTILFKVISKAEKVVSIPYVGYHYVDTVGSTVHTHSLKNAVDYYLAVKENTKDVTSLRADLLETAWKRQLRSIIPVWCIACAKERTAALKKYPELLLEIIEFVKQHKKLISDCPDVGGLGRSILNSIALFGRSALELDWLPAFLYCRRHEN